MNTALWPATWGYYLTNMIGFDGTGPHRRACSPGRAQHFIDHVRGGGPLPTLRCGRQPYGVLPVTSLDLWQPPRRRGGGARAADVWLRTLLQQLRDNVWRAAAARGAARSAAHAPTRTPTSADVMRTDALSSSYAMRALLGRHYLQHLRAFLGEDLAAQRLDRAAGRRSPVGILQRLGFAWRPRLLRSVYGDAAWRVSAPLVQAGEVSRWRPLEPNYIAALLAEPQIDAHRAPTTCRRRRRRACCTRCCATRCCWSTPARPPRILATRRAPRCRRCCATPSWSIWSAARRRRSPGAASSTSACAAVTGDTTIREHLESPAGLQARRPPHRCGEFRAASRMLQGLDSEALQYLMQGTLDLASHRLDAWITSFATKRLAAMRAPRPAGLVRRRLRLGREPAAGRGCGTPVRRRRRASRRRSSRSPTTPASSTRRR